MLKNEGFLKLHVKDKFSFFTFKMCGKKTGKVFGHFLDDCQNEFLTRETFVEKSV